MGFNHRENPCGNLYWLKARQIDQKYARQFDPAPYSQFAEIRVFCNDDPRLRPSQFGKPLVREPLELFGCGNDIVA